MKKSFRILKSELSDKIRGGWTGKSYGAMMGEPMEFHAQGEIYEGSLDIHPKAPKIWLHNEDDLYTNMAFLEIMRDKGLHATRENFADVFRHTDFMLWHANGQARQNLMRGIAPGLSGHPYYNPHADDIDFQIECDFIGIISPGMPRSAVDVADKVGHIMNYGDGYYAGAFLAALYTYAYIETDMLVMIRQALKAIPAESKYAAMIHDLLKWYDEDPTDWRTAWQKLEGKWNFDLCPWAKSDPPSKCGGVVDRFNIQGHFNGAYILIGLLYGNGKYLESIKICTRCGQDTDSNVANCGGIMGVMTGYAGLPQTVKDELQPYMDRDYNFTSLSINSASLLSYDLALENIVENGGSVDGDQITLALQEYEFDGECEVSFPDLTMVEVFKVHPKLSPALKWHGDWEHPSERKDGKRSPECLVSDMAGDYLEVQFSGTCVYVQGNMHDGCGIHDIYIDGELLQSVDMYNRTEWNGQVQSTAAWIVNLPDKNHVMRIVVTGRKRPESTGIEVQLGRVVSYRGEIAMPVDME